MIVHNEDTLQQALTLVEQSPVRYSDQYAYVVVSSLNSLEKLCRSALGRKDVAVVVPVGQESSMEEHVRVKLRILDQRKRQELKDVKKWIAEHPELKEARTEQEVIKLYHKERKDLA